MTNAQVKVIKPEDFKVENCVFSEPKENKRGGKVVYINYDYKDGTAPRPLRIKLPKMHVPFGISAFKENKTDKMDIEPTETSGDSIDISFSSYESKELNMFCKFDEAAVNYGKEHSLEFFKKKMNKDIVKEFYTSPIKYTKQKDDKGQETGEINPNFPPRIKTKLYKDQQYNYTGLTIFDSNGVKTDKLNIKNYKEILPKGSDVISVLECSSMWCVTGKFGITWRPVQMKVFKNEKSLDDSEFVGDDEEYAEETENLIESISELEVDDLDKPVSSPKSKKK